MIIDLPPLTSPAFDRPRPDGRTTPQHPRWGVWVDGRFWCDGTHATRVRAEGLGERISAACA